MRFLFLSSILPFACRSEDGVKIYNSQPQVSITSHADGAELQDGYPVLFIGQVSDANHSNDLLLTRWSTNNGDVCADAPPSDNGESTCEVVLTEADTEIRLQAIDPEGSAGVQSISLSVLPTEPPNAQIIAPVVSGTYYSDQKITFEGIVSDSEDTAEALSARWASDLDGELSDVDASVDTEGGLLGYGYLSQGEHAIELQVEDSTGKTDTASVVITVGPPNSAPSCTITEPAMGASGPINANINFMATVSDVDIPSDQLSVSWVSDKDGAIGTSTPTSSGDVLFSFSDLSVNTHTITMTVTDEVGATCTDLVSYTVGTPPELTIESPLNGDVFTEGESINFSVQVADEQTQPSDIALEWLLNGSVVSSQTASSSGVAQWFDSNLSYGEYNLFVTATDTDGLTDSAQINFTVNGQPSQPEVSITPEPAATSDDLSVVFSNESIDPEGSSIVYSYEWLQNGTLQSIYSASTLPFSATSKGEEWTVRVTPNDGLTNGPFATASIIIANTSPEISTVSISPTGTVYNDDTISCTATATDPDESPVLTYEWTHNSSVLGNGASLSLLNSGVMPLDDVVCTATATDSDGASVQQSTTTTISNRAPTVTSVSITPTSATTTSELICVGEASDADGESPSLSYSWQIGSNTYSGAVLSLDPGMVSPSDSVTCIVEAEDGFGGTATDSVSIQVDNTAPEITVSIVAAGVGNSAELTCVGTATDIDDAPTVPMLSYEWRDASGAVLGSSDVLQLNDTIGVDGDIVQCVATATDLMGATTSASEEHTITNSPPVIDSIMFSSPAIYSNSFYEGCTIVSSDADGDPITYEYEWFVEGVLVSTDDLIINPPFVVGETITCRVTPNDGKEDGDYAEASMVVSNTLPTVTAISFSPSSINTNDTVTANASIGDGDSGQTITGSYEWHVIDVATGSDSIVQAGGDNTLDGALFFDRDDEVYVVVTPNDGIDDGASMSSSSITISNTVPEAPEISIAPTPATLGQDDLVCSIDTPAADDDGDTIVYTFTWTDPDGTVQQTTTQTTGTFDTFSVSSLTEGVWECTVVPNDGTDDGALATSTAAVETGCVGFDFDGSSNLEVQDSSALAVSSVTVETWVYVQNAQHEGYIVSKKGRAYGGHVAYGIRQTKDQFTVRFQVASCLSCTDSIHFIDLRSQPIQEGRWYHVVARYDETSGLGSLFVNGTEQDSVTRGTGLVYTSNSEPLAVGSTHVSSVTTEESYWDGTLSHLNIFSQALSDSDISSLAQGSTISAVPQLAYNGNINGSTVDDQSGNGHHANVDGVSSIDECHSQDVDEDGVLAWEDCNDGDASVFASGSASNCTGLSCVSILEDGYSVGDGSYWLEPNGVAPFEAHCDMTNNGGGWTYVYGWTAGNPFPSADVFFSGITSSYTNILSLNMLLGDIPRHQKVRLACQDDTSYEYIGLGSLHDVDSSCGRYDSCWTLTPDTNYQGNLYGWHHSIETSWGTSEETGGPISGAWKWNIYPTNGTASDCGVGNTDTNPPNGSFYRISVQ